MAADLVWESSTSTGTGDLTVAAVARRFSAAFGTGSGNSFRYSIINRNAVEWETGIGYMSDANTLVRDSVITSSNSNNAVNFSAGTKDICNFLSASELITTANLFNPLTPVEISSSSTPTPDLSQGRKFTLAFATNFTLQPAINCSVGDEFVIHFTRASSATADYASAYKGHNGNLPVINTGTSQRTRVHFEVTAVSSGTATEILAMAGGGLWA